MDEFLTAFNSRFTIAAVNVACFCTRAEIMSLFVIIPINVAASIPIFSRMDRTDGTERLRER